MNKSYADIINIAYNKSKFKEQVSLDVYKMLAMVYIKFIYTVMNNKQLKRVRFPGLCLFYPSTKTINKAITRLSSIEGREERVSELSNILNNLNKNGKSKQKKIG